MDTMFILVWARESPTSSGGGGVCIILHLCACTRVNRRVSELWVLSPDHVKLGWRGMVYASELFYVSCCCFSLGAPFYRSKGGTRLQDVGGRVGLDRGIVTLIF